MEDMNPIIHQRLALHRRAEYSGRGAPRPITPKIGDKYTIFMCGKNINYTITATGPGQDDIRLTNDDTGTSWTTGPAGFAVHIRGGLTRCPGR